MRRAKARLSPAAWAGEWWGATAHAVKDDVVTDGEDGVVAVVDASDAVCAVEPGPGGDGGAKFARGELVKVREIQPLRNHDDDGSNDKINDR